MTTLAAALGALPLAIGFGEGSELRRPLGVAIIGGLIASQVLTLLTTPVVYLYVDRCAGGPATKPISAAPARAPIRLTCGQSPPRMFAMSSFPSLSAG